jgi:hypothetical protein
MLSKVHRKKKANTLNKKNLRIDARNKKRLLLSSLISYIVKNMNKLLARVHPGFSLSSYSITKNVKFNKMSMRLTPLVSCSKTDLI